MLRSVKISVLLSLVSFGCASEQLPVYEFDFMGIWRGDSGGDEFRFGEYPANEVDIQLSILSNADGNVFTWSSRLEPHSSCPGDCPCPNSTQTFEATRSHSGFWVYNETLDEIELEIDPITGVTQLCDQDSNTGSLATYSNFTFKYTPNVRETSGQRDEMVLELNSILDGSGSSISLTNNTTYSLDFVGTGVN